VNSEGAGFWVIFDTCTRPDYYADVHKLIALPPGWILRYDYRRKYLGQQAEEAIFGNAYQPNDALLIYAQSKSYSRGSEELSDQVPDDMVFCPTRLAEIALIPTPDGERAYFDIKVGGYPSPDNDSLDAIISGLLPKGETPYRKWVAISPLANAFHALQATSSDTNWERIVDVLATPPMQFIGDTFWRLGSPTRPKESARPVDEELTRMRDGGEEIYQVVSHFELKEGHECLLAISSHTPSDKGGEVEERKNLEVVSRSDKLKIVSSQIELRRYSQDTIRIRAAKSDQAGTAIERVSLATAPPRQGWPRGASFDLSFRISKAPARVALGVALLILAAVLASGAVPAKGVARLVLAGAAALATIAGVFVLTGKLAKP
jgi:hypothetical protein